MTPVKICGLTRPQDVDLACQFGAAFVGFNFSRRSPRRVRLSDAGLASAVRGARKVGVVVNETPAEIREAVEVFGLDVVQVHRPLREDDLELPVPIVAVCRAGPRGLDLPAGPLWRRCHALLVDSGGGSGQPFDWGAFDWGALDRVVSPVPLWLAGGLTPENVGRAIARVHPALVDVASGVESSPGVKDPEKMKSFFEVVKSVEV